MPDLQGAAHGSRARRALHWRAAKPRCVGWASAAALHGRCAGLGVGLYDGESHSRMREGTCENSCRAIKELRSGNREISGAALWVAKKRRKGQNVGMGADDRPALMAASCRFGSRKNGRSPPPPAMKNVYRCIHHCRSGNWHNCRNCGYVSRPKFTSQDPPKISTRG